MSKKYIGSNSVRTLVNLTKKDSKAKMDEHLKASNPHNITKSTVGLGNVGNYKAVSTVASQGLSDTEKSNARTNIGAGTSSFSGSYTDLTNKPTIPTVNNATLTIQKNGTTVQTFTANQSTAVTANITVPTKTSELTNDSGYKTTDTTYSAATTSTAGLMSAADKTKLDGIATGAQVNTVTGVKGNSETSYRTGQVNITAANIGLGNVGNYKAVSTAANQGLTDAEKANARSNIGAGASSFSGSYTDLTDKPTIPTKTSELTNDSGFVTSVPTVNNGTLTIQKNGTTVQTFTANQSTAVTANITVPTKTSELTNDSGYKTTDTTYSAATTSTAGLMSAADKTKLDGIATGAQVNTVTGVKGNSETSYRTGQVNITAANIGLGSVGNFKAVSTVASQGLTDAEKSNARTNISAGTSSFSGSYTDLTDKPTIPTVNNATLTIQKNGTSVGTFTANSSTAVTANITVPTKTSELTNDSGYKTTDNNTIPSAYCTTAAATAAKVASFSGYVLRTNSWFQLVISTTNTAASALTLNVNNTGAKTIYINGTASSSSNYTLPAGVYWVYYDGTNYNLRTTQIYTNYTIDIGRKADTDVGAYSTAEGNNTTASATYSHAEGDTTVASGVQSHAEGQTTNATGQASHAEGGNTTASGYASHAEGDNCQAVGSRSHAEGYNTTASGAYSHAEGYKSTTDANATSAHAEGHETKATGNYSHAEGYNTKATASYSHAEGCETTASGLQSHAEGGYTTASYDYAHAEGASTTASGKKSHAEGESSVASGFVSHAEGNSKSLGNYTHSEGCNTIASGSEAHAEGEGSIASGEQSHAEGMYTTANANYSHAEGYYNSTNNADAYGAHAEGYHTIASGKGSHAEGGVDASTSTSDQQKYTTASGGYSHAEGNTTYAYGDASHAEGNNVYAYGDASHAEGISTNAGWDNDGTYKGHGSHAEGHQSVARDDYSHAEGNSTTAGGEAAHAEGKNTTTSSEAAHAEGYQSAASSYASHAEGYSTTASGYSSHAEGNNTTASGGYSHAEGQITKAYGSWSHAEGYASTASGNYGSHAEGYDCIASGDSSHAEGASTKATGIRSHAEGYESIASGYYSHAEGGGTCEATGNAAHAEGYKTKAVADYTHTEGYMTYASGYLSHAEGYGQYSSQKGARGQYSHVEGYCVDGQGQANHTEGYWTIGTGAYQHVQGRYNVEDTTSTYAHIVGGGDLRTQTRKNIHTLDWDGNGWFNGDVTTESGFSLNKSLQKFAQVTGVSTDAETIELTAGNEYIVVICARNASTDAVYGATVRAILVPGESSTTNVTLLALGSTSNAGYTLTAGSFLITVKASATTYTVDCTVYEIAK